MVTDLDVADQIVEAVAAWVDKEVVPNASKFELADEFPDEMVEQMKAFGLFGCVIPEQYGGLGLDHITYARLIEEISRGFMSLGGGAQQPPDRVHDDPALWHRGPTRTLVA